MCGIFYCFTIAEWVNKEGTTLSQLYLIDAKAEGGNTVRLKFYDALHASIKETTDSSYKPYFFLPHPLSKQDEEAIRNLNGETQIVKKIDLYTNQSKEVTKITVYRPEYLKKAQRKFENAWETEIEYNHSYAYDHGLIFGAEHTLIQNNHYTPSLSLTPDLKTKFNTLFSQIKDTDPLKYAQLERWFTVLN